MTRIPFFLFVFIGNLGIGLMMTLTQTIAQAVFVVCLFIALLALTLTIIHFTSDPITPDEQDSQTLRELTEQQMAIEYLKALVEIEHSENGHKAENNEHTTE